MRRRYEHGIVGPDALSGSYSGTPNADRLTGTKGMDFFYGSPGIDILDGKAGYDTLSCDFRAGKNGMSYSSDVTYDFSKASYGGSLNWSSGTTTFLNMERIGLRLGASDDFLSVFYAPGTPDLTVIGADGGSGLDTLDITYTGQVDQTFSLGTSFTGFERVYLLFGSGNDVLTGTDGDDVLNGGAGSDELTGGAGADVFRYTNPNGSTVRLSDEITDFNHSERDLIDLSYIDARTDDGDQAFKFIGQKAFSGTQEGELRSFAIGNGQYMVQADIDGDTRPDMSIVVDSATKLVASDFIL